ncbi:MAG: hypothetical protein MR652_07215, partial [Blautia sp.]|uniref:hypothetical protein n=1 Tax=Blautia sp. TaxID=1955243 RepID=UPI0025BF6838
IGTCRGRQSYQIPAGLKYEIKSASNESVVSITKKLLLCTTPSFEALTGIIQDFMQKSNENSAQNAKKQRIRLYPGKFSAL